MNEFLSVTQYAAKHGMDAGRVRVLIRDNRIPAQKIGSQWVIPADTPKPEDKRVKSGKYRDFRKKQNTKEG